MVSTVLRSNGERVLGVFRNEIDQGPGPKDRLLVVYANTASVDPPLDPGLCLA